MPSAADMRKIVVDCLGGDKSPDANVEGALLALDRFSELQLTLTGDEAVLNERLEKMRNGRDLSRVSVVHAPETITGEDKPTDAIRLKKNSSLMTAIRLLREDGSYDGMVSSGATGSIVAASTLRVGRIEGLYRPAFCPVLPTMNGGIVGICDSGANVDCSPLQLQQFALLGSQYLKAVFGIEQPRVALLNIGTETEKGDQLRKETYPLLAGMEDIRFCGNMESRDLLTGKYDLVVCDGFSGNVLVKSTEGACLEMLKMLKRDIYSKKIYKLGALLQKSMFKKEKEFMNYQNYGGSVLLGIRKVIVKGHGSSNATSIAKCVEQAVRMADHDYAGRMEVLLAKYEQTATADLTE